MDECKPLVYGRMRAAELALLRQTGGGGGGRRRRFGGGGGGGGGDGGPGSRFGGQKFNTPGAVGAAAGRGSHSATFQLNLSCF